MVDLAAFGTVFVVVLVVFVRKSSAGIAILSLLAGVLLDQLLASWIIGSIPAIDSAASQYIPIIIHLFIVFGPVVASLVALKVPKHSVVLSLLTSLILGFLVVSFGLKIIAPLPFVNEAAKNSGLLTFLDPYKNAILACSALLAVAEMIISHRTKFGDKKKK